MRPRTLRLDSRARSFTMLVLGATVVAIALAGRVAADEKSAVSLEAELPQFIAACNRVVEGGKRRAMRACETLAKANRLGFADPVASSGYQRYQRNLEWWQTCHRNQTAGARWSCVLPTELKRR